MKILNRIIERNYVPFSKEDSKEHSKKLKELLIKGASRIIRLNMNSKKVIVEESENTKTTINA